MKVNTHYKFYGELDVDIPNGENMTEDEIVRYLYNHLPVSGDNVTIYNAIKILEDGREEVIFEY